MNLKSERLKASKSQKEIAEIANVTQATYSGWETGKFEVDLKHLVDLANYFNVTTDYLLGRTENPKNEEIKTDEIKFDDLEFALFGEVREFDDELKSKILEYAQLLKLKKEAQKKKAEGK